MAIFSFKYKNICFDIILSNIVLEGVMSQQIQTESDRLVLDARKNLSMTGVQSVDGFGEQFLSLTVYGNKVKIVGENIKISSYNKSTGSFSADGIFNEIKYNHKKVPFVKRLFK